MKKIEDFKQYSALVMPHIKARALTNAFDSADKIRGEIQAGSLFYECDKGFLLIFHKRQDFFKLSFYCDKNAIAQTDIKEKIVCEIASKSGFCQYENILKSLCLEKTDSRLRYTIPPIQKEVPHGIEIKNEQSDHGIISACFDKYTGCIPQGEINCLCAYVKGSFAGALHYEANEIRHLATLPQFRGKGVGKALVFAFSSNANKNIKVWTSHSNTAARALYEKCGAVPDGYTSVITKRNF